MSVDRAAFESLLAPLVESLDLVLGWDQIDRLWWHYSLLWRWSGRVNLTSIRRPEEIVRRHFGESLAVAKLIGEGEGSVVDVGSGAGFPGIPIAACFPSRHITLVESVGKKVTFLKEVARGYRNVVVYGGRFEDLRGQRFEWGCLRAVAADSVGERLVELSNRVAVLASASASEEICGDLGLSGVRTHTLPWDSRTVILSGELPSST